MKQIEQYPMQKVVPMLGDDIDFMMATRARPVDWRLAQKVADDAINAASKSALRNGRNGR